MSVLNNYKTSATFILFLLFSFLLSIQPLWAAIGPEEVAVIVNTESKDSMRIGEMYMRLRNVPARNLIRISTPVSEGISRTDYEELIALPVRQALLMLYNEGARIRCILTTYGVPLRVGPMRPLINPEERIRKYEKLISEKDREVSLLKEERKKNIKTKEEADRKLLNELSRNIKKLELEIIKLNVELNGLKGHDTGVAVDSELALLFTPGHQLSGWLPNPEYIFNRERYKKDIGRVFMVSRLDAPSPELAEGLVRTAIEVEQTGLSGKVYLDARGKTGKDAYGRFDEDIRRTAMILEKGSMPVVLDNKARLFRRGEAPSAALYCGWYSHKNYVDAFEWSKGAVGYHVASSEAVSLHNPKRKYWVKSMIEKGVIASIGPVSEPYLSAFPPPSIFFPLFMSGEYTLVEVFAMTNPFLSWQMILVGDPLYNPFRNNPAFFIKDPPPPPE
ncbi:MAG: TIGR03790 family protein [Nitrospira sp.]|nr:TIGR03790 family protein [Nitrospira sp.]